MFKTIKLNKAYWQKKIPNLKYGVPDPLNVLSADNDKFSEALTTFNFFGVFKTTKAGRHRQTQLFIKGLLPVFDQPVSLLDIGASDGSTSLDWITLINGYLKKYYVTDYNIKCTYAQYKGYTYFFNNKNECLLTASEKFVFYPDNAWLFDLLFNKPLAAVKQLPKNELLFINRDLQQKQQHDGRIEIMEYNIFEPWAREKTDMVIVGNLLNRAYFTDTQIELAIKNCYDALQDNGLLIIIRNSLNENGGENEKSTIYKKDSSAGVLIKIHTVNEGIEIDDLVLSLRF